MKENNNKSVMHIAAIALGVISIMTAWFWYLTIPTGILAIILGTKSAKKTGSKIGKTGMITGIVGLCLFAFSYVGMTIILILSNM